ncbi:MAG TPA: cupin domain-containing protein [Bryobacteraceae bacterium]|nr:cupin domain-containing protein [Bryobacteraceae bacterium]
MRPHSKLALMSAGCLLGGWAVAQQGGPKEEASWAPKPAAASKWIPPNKPHTKFADLKEKYKGKADWREVIASDPLLHAEYISMAPGSKVSKRFHPDTREWWIVMDGQIRFEIEGQAPFVATKGSMVQAPMQTIYGMEAVGNTPALRFEVNIANAHTLYPKASEPPKIAGIEWIPVVLNRKPAPYDNGNKPHINLYGLEKDPAYKGGRFVHDDRAVSNIIYGSEKNLPPLNPKDRGHYHPESSEFWLIMQGQIRYPVEYHGTIIASEGDVVYVPPFTFHAPRFHGNGPSTRLAINGYPNIAHLRDPITPH